MIYFKTRTLAREFSNKQDHYKFVDGGANSPTNQRWGVRFIKQTLTSLN